MTSHQLYNDSTLNEMTLFEGLAAVQDHLILIVLSPNVL